MYEIISMYLCFSIFSDFKEKIEKKGGMYNVKSIGFCVIRSKLGE